MIEQSGLDSLPVQPKNLNSGLCSPLSFKDLDFSFRSGSQPVIPSGVEGSRTICGGNHTSHRRTRWFCGGCTLRPQTGRDPSTSVGMTEGTRLLRTLHHDLMNNEPRKENRLFSEQFTAGEAGGEDFFNNLLVS